MSGERLELVTRFEDLRAGMLVVDFDDCGVCGAGRVRGILVRLWYDAPDIDDEDPATAWEMSPICCGDPDEQFRGITADDVAAHSIYRVVDPDADKAETTETETPRKIAEFMVHPSGLVVEWKE